MSDRFTKHSYHVKSTCEWEKTCESHLSWCYPNNCYISNLNWIMGKHTILLIKWRDRVATRKKVQENCTLECWWSCKYNGLGSRNWNTVAIFSFPKKYWFYRENFKITDAFFWKWIDFQKLAKSDSEVGWTWFFFFLKVQTHSFQGKLIRNSETVYTKN